MPITSEFSRVYSSFSGVDIKAVIAGKVIGSMQGIGVAVSREKAPIYTMGSPDLRAISRGKRGIAGSMVFIQFDSDPIMWELANPDDVNKQLYFISDVDDVRPDFKAPAFSTDVTNITPGTPGQAVGAQESDLVDTGSDQEIAVPWYPDQIPPFDVILAAANEYGALATMRVLGVELMNNGFGVSVDDMVAEHSYTYIAHGMLYWRTQGIFPGSDTMNPR